MRSWRAGQEDLELTSLGGQGQNRRPGNRKINDFASLNDFARLNHSYPRHSRMQEIRTELAKPSLGGAVPLGGSR